MILPALNDILQQIALMHQYIYQKQNWPKFSWDTEYLLPKLGAVRNLQGKILGFMESLGFELKAEASFETLALDILKTNEIEGEILNREEVRSSLARRLGMDLVGLIPSARNVDGVVDMMVDAIQNNEKEITEERLFSWHSSLFPEGRSGMYKILAGQYRQDTTGPMQVVSGAMGMEKVHFQAPGSAEIKGEMDLFIKWFNTENHHDPVLKAGIAHFWFITIHPFEDGNGRIARALTDLLLSRSDGVIQRYYSMSSQILKERKGYYEILEKSQKGTLDITMWLDWFMDCLTESLNSSDEVLSKVIYKAKFWNIHAMEKLNSRQVLMLNKLLDGFFGKLTSKKWSKITKCSTDTALRDIQNLISKGILRKEGAGGRSTNYEMVEMEKK
ncbi:MAG: Fic family protein [Polaribacter sp.]